MGHAFQSSCSGGGVGGLLGFTAFGREWSIRPGGCYSAGVLVLGTGGTGSVRCAASVSVRWFDRAANWYRGVVASLFGPSYLACRPRYVQRVLPFRDRPPRGLRHGRIVWLGFGVLLLISLLRLRSPSNSPTAQPIATFTPAGGGGQRFFTSSEHDAPPVRLARLVETPVYSSYYGSLENIVMHRLAFEERNGHENDQRRSLGGLAPHPRNSRCISAFEITVSRRRRAGVARGLPLPSMPYAASSSRRFCRPDRS